MKTSLFDRHAIRPALITALLGICASLVTVALFGGKADTSAPLLLCLVMMSAVLSAVQTINFPPGYALMSFAGPRHIVMIAVGVGLSWCAKEAGVDFTRFADKLFVADKIWGPVGMFAGYCSAMFYTLFYIGCHGEAGERCWNQ